MHSACACEIFFYPFIYSGSVTVPDCPHTQVEHWIGCKPTKFLKLFDKIPDQPVQFFYLPQLYLAFFNLFVLLSNNFCVISSPAIKNCGGLSHSFLPDFHDAWISIYQICSKGKPPEQQYKVTARLWLAHCYKTIWYSAVSPLPPSTTPFWKIPFAPDHGTRLILSFIESRLTVPGSCIVDHY